jgi:hypothetical protein
MFTYCGPSKFGEDDIVRVDVSQSKNGVLINVDDVSRLDEDVVGV